MPRLYVTPLEIQESSLGLGLASQISLLGTGVLDKMLARASQRADNFTRKRLQAPGTTTLASTISVGATSFSVASTLTLDSLAEQALIINSGGATQETIAIQPGGIAVTSWTSPYPGTITLATPCVYGHSIGEPITFVYMEVTEAGSASSSDPYTEALDTQAMQLALAHLPSAHGSLTRVIFLKSYPIIQIYNIMHAFSFTNQFNQVDLTIESIVPNEGWYRMNVGAVIIREGLIQTTYTAGYQVVPDDIKDAVSHFFADMMMQMSNPFMAVGLTLGKKSQRWDVKDGVTPNAAIAMDTLKQYRRTV